MGHPRGGRPYRHQVRMRHRAMRRLHRPCRWADIALLLGAGLGGRQSPGDNDRGPVIARREGGAKSVGGPRCRAVRLLPVGTDHVGDRPAGEEAQAGRHRHRPRDGRQHLSLRDLPAHPRSDPRRVGAACCLRRRTMHPLMNRFHTDEQRRLMELLGVRESSPPLLSRRVFLQSAGATGLVIGFGWLAPTGAEAALPGAEGAAAGPLAPNAFVRVGTDNLVTVICKHHEMGQGNTTGLASLVADELDADWSLVRTEYAPSDPKLYNNLNFGPMQGTGGSSAMANSFLQYRGAGATARAMLVAAAAEAWQVPAGGIRTSKSTLTQESGRRATYGEMAVPESRQTPPDNPPLKKASQFTFITKDRSTPRVDSPSKCNGTAMYTADVKLPGLLTAVIAWPPGFGAQLVSFDAADAKKVKGVTDVVEVPEGVAVVATGTWAALQGRRALKVQWDESSSKDLDSEALLARYRAQAGQPGTPFTKPTTTSATPAVVKTIEAVYEFPFLAHASMEPMNCVAWLHDGMLSTWSGPQFPSFGHMV